MGIVEDIAERLQNIEDKLDRLNKQDTGIKPLMDREDVAEFLSISPEMVYSLWRENRLGYVKIGSRKVSTVQQIEKYIKDNSIEGVNRREYRNNITVLGG